MNRFGKIAICLAGGLIFTARLQADGPAVIAAAAGDPYSPIVDRNVFGLLPPPAPVDPSIAADASLPKITANGIMDVFGNLKVLFKTSGKPGEKDSYYDLAEGQSEDDIVVVKIDENAKIVTFNNHGDTQQIALVMPSSSGGGGGNGSGGGMSGEFGGRPGFNPGGGYNGGGFNGGSGGFNRPGYSGGGQTGFNGNNGGNNGGGASGGINVNGQQLNFGQNAFHGSPPPPSGQMSPEDQVIMIEQQRMQLQNQGDTKASILPPTILTPLLNSSGGNDQGAQ